VLRECDFRLGKNGLKEQEEMFVEVCFIEQEEQFLGEAPGGRSIGAESDETRVEFEKKDLMLDPKERLQANISLQIMLLEGQDYF